MNTHNDNNVPSQGSKPPASGVSYYFNVDGKNYDFDHQHTTGLEILTASHHDPEKFDLWIKFSDGRKELVSQNTPIDLGASGIEKFRTLPKKLTDGGGLEAPPPLTYEDFEFLNSSKLEWEIVPWNGNYLLKIRNWPVPAGYNISASDLSIVMPATYPSAQLDMFYFRNPLARESGIPIKAISDENFNGEIWQRWSRHRDAGTEWRPGVDDVSTHLMLVDKSLANELSRQT